MIWLPFWSAWRHRSRGQELKAKLIAAEEVVSTEAEAFWIVHEVGGGIRYVRAHLFTHDGDYAMPVSQPAGFVVLKPAKPADV